MIVHLILGITLVNVAVVMVTTHVRTLAGEQLKKKEFVILERTERNGKFVHLYIRN